MKSDCSVPEVSGSGCSANKFMLMLMLVPLNQFNLYLLLQVQLPNKIF